MTRGSLTARFAALVSEFGLTLPQILELTPRQSEDVYFHPRDKDGGIKLPEGSMGIPIDQTARIAQLLALKDAFRIPPEQVAELQRRLEVAQNGKS